MAKGLWLDDLPSPSMMPPLEAPACTKKKRGQNSKGTFLQKDSSMPSLDSGKSRDPPKPDVGRMIFHAIDASQVNPEEGVCLEKFRDEFAQLNLNNDMKATMLLEMLSMVESTHLPREILQNAWLRIVEEERQDILELSTSTPPRSPREAISPPHTGRPSTSGASTKLSLAKSKRKQAEYDAKLLANRLALLQQEEVKAWRKIEQTREKAQQILEHREEIVKKQQDKHMLLHEKEQTIRTATKRHKLAAKTSVIRKRQAAISVISKKYQEVETVKTERRRLKQEKEKQIVDDVMRAKEKRERVRKMEDEMRKKRAKEKMAADKQIVQRYRKNVEDEEVQLRAQQRRVADMERAEMELIQRLQSTQLLQRQAYDELEKALVRTEL
ncbi:Aste57867_20761 [Aphanomyces stellatus]|uniref:Aste57867_20761 protein n=2 Tax=Aphanomyces stellatus TaxID=120398 RepID=A0A485LFQ4_9STRA|nr:hypothetical protein As57867_020693 [Aphanomyces stellatus]VFT97440.1 Aste57867_20761 [Aphanomyces stellatus]